MDRPISRWTDERLEHLLARLLRLGVALSAAVILLGGIAYLRERGAGMPRQHIFHGEPAELRHTWTIVQAALAFQSRGIIQLGVLLLIATPIARVAFSVIGFLLRRDWLYVTVTLIVLGVLLYSLVGQHP